MNMSDYMKDKLEAIESEELAFVLDCEFGLEVESVIKELN